MCVFLYCSVRDDANAYNNNIRRWKEVLHYFAQLISNKLVEMDSIHNTVNVPFRKVLH